MATAADEMLDAEVLAICPLSEQHNARSGITGMLTLHDSRFAQVLKGAEAEV